ncbi:hypothetical protein TNCV_19661 [Trichonephila clavipes]|nr:hypothetical protein TNCV_19661 [Trichonephila clavipes]
MRSGRMNAMQFVEDLLIPSLFAIHDEYSSVLKSLNLGNRQAAACLHFMDRAAVSACSLPSIPTCPGTQENYIKTLPF